MVQDNEVYHAIQQLYDGKPVAISRLKRKFHGDPGLEESLQRLEAQGKIRSVSIKGGKGFELSSDKLDLVLLEIVNLRDEVKKLRESLQEKSKIRLDHFDEVYNRVRDNLGYAHLQVIRVEMGLGKEEFYSSLRSHIEANYDLIAGGEEGFVRKGSVYGIVKKKR
ncbi:hypothetical protein [Metallosphaera hakonensis]|uniref:Uncharacterized protein n=1 Tax=Metallosphaera hakonensis JCM 8857 = DSM 7519 TaxID=1293036 RepID=A0A2U9IR00_9CREN|nr:hypothetical protein [Metallosphaera hakonensis]AWR98413.1 hypothetical protein DFR87_00355 [Metallosphaera hakonensis JCM 8857 = DSM 7519]